MEGGGRRGGIWHQCAAIDCASHYQYRIRSALGLSAPPTPPTVNIKNTKPHPAATSTAATSVALSPAPASPRPLLIAQERFGKESKHEHTQERSRSLFRKGLWGVELIEKKKTGRRGLAAIPRSAPPGRRGKEEEEKKEERKR